MKEISKPILRPSPLQPLTAMGIVMNMNGGQCKRAEDKFSPLDSSDPKMCT